MENSGLKTTKHRDNPMLAIMEEDEFINDEEISQHQKETATTKNRKKGSL